MNEPITLVAILTVRCAALETFRAFEHIAARAMARYGGAIERTVVAPEPGNDGLMKEIHIVKFPSLKAFEAYQNDAEVRAAAHMRHESVVASEIFTGIDGPDYGAGVRA